MLAKLFSVIRAAKSGTLDCAAQKQQIVDVFLSRSQNFCVAARYDCRNPHDHYPRLLVEMLPEECGFRHSQRQVGAGERLRAGSAKNYLSRARQNLQVQPKGPIFHVSEIERHIAIERGVMPCPNLPQAGEPRQHLQTAEVL
jgi:hypothetical protein